MPTKFGGMAGVLAFAMLSCCIIVQHHSFIDGNKRAGTMAAFVFMKLNGLTLEADESAFEALVLQAAQGQVGKDAIADFFRENAKS